MEIFILILTIIGTAVAVGAYFRNQKQTALEKKSKILELHGRNVVELERLMLEIANITDAHDVGDERFMQGFTYNEAIDFLRENRNKLMEMKQVISDHGEKMDIDEIEKNIQRLSDNLIQFDYIRNRLPRAGNSS